MITVQGPGKSDYTDLMSLVQAQQSRLQSQQAEIKHVSRQSRAVKRILIFTIYYGPSPNTVETVSKFR